MVTKKQLEQKLKQEFDTMLPNILLKIQKTKVLPAPLGFEINLKQQAVINMTQLVIASTLVVGVMSYGGYSYYSPNTIMSITVTPTILNSLLNLNLATQVSEANTPSVNITLAINDYSRVVEVAADEEEYHQALNNMGLRNKNYQTALHELFGLLDSRGNIDMNDNFGQVKIMVLDPNNNRVVRMQKYIGENLPKELGIINKRMIISEYVEYNSSTGLSPTVHPAKAMAIQEIMLQTDRYTFDELVAMDKMQLLRVMMEIKRSKR